MAEENKNYVSIWFWLAAMFVMAIPLVNLVMMFVWAFAGENESRKNYFKALIVVMLFWVGIIILAVITGFLPEILKHLEKFSQGAR